MVLLQCRRFQEGNSCGANKASQSVHELTTLRSFARLLALPLPAAFPRAGAGSLLSWLLGASFGHRQTNGVRRRPQVSFRRALDAWLVCCRPARHAWPWPQPVALAGTVGAVSAPTSSGRAPIGDSVDVTSLSPIGASIRPGAPSATPMLASHGQLVAMDSLFAAAHKHWVVSAGLTWPSSQAIELSWQVTQYLHSFWSVVPVQSSS